MPKLTSKISIEQLGEESYGHDREARRMIEKHNRQKKLDDVIRFKYLPYGDWE